MRCRKALTLIEALVSISIIGLLIGIICPAVVAARESARLVQCKNNLRMIAMGLRSFETAFRRLPSGGWGTDWIGDSRLGVGESQPGGWLFQLLPYVEQEVMFRKLPEGEGELLLEKGIAIFNCPSRRSTGPFELSRDWRPVNCRRPSALARNDYAINGGPIFVAYGPGPRSYVESVKYAWPSMVTNRGVCFLRSSVRLAGILDGLSNTYLCGEKLVPRDAYINGKDFGDNESMYSGDDRDLSRFVMLPPEPDNGTSLLLRHGLLFGSPHSVGCAMGFCDGSVRVSSFSIDMPLHVSLGTINDGGPNDYE